ncbi:YceI family protein [Thermus sp.]|uniref:YceI family protein n=1 Tax=Thermus sp. TaxID=275 RepID=UPI00307E9BED
MRRFLAFLALMVAWTLADSTPYTLQGRVVYEGRAPLGSWKGENPTLEGQVAWDKATGALRGRVCLDQRRWDSGEPLRDSHTRKLFEVDRYPQACLELEGLEGPVPGPVTIRGVLEIHGVKKPVRISGEVQAQGKALIFQGGFTTRITDWGMTPPSLMGMRVRDEVQVQIWAEVRP